MVKRAGLAFLAISLASGVFAGGEMIEGGSVTHKTIESRPVPSSGRSLPKSAIGPLQGSCVARDEPLPAPERHIGEGYGCNEVYGPTYYYPSAHNEYEGLHPTYYPFFHPRLWPNYKAPASYCPGRLCGSSRSDWAWDSYDDWTRGARYDQHQ